VRVSGALTACTESIICMKTGAFALTTICYGGHRNDQGFSMLSVTDVLKSNGSFESMSVLNNKIKVFV
jgi:hypothetical protein